MKQEIRGIIITVVVLVAICILILYATHPETFGANFNKFLHHNDTCSLGVYGTAANMTLTGGDSECESIRELSVGSDGKTVFYVMTSEPTGNVMCEGDTQDGYHYIVRDTGLFNIVGNDLCSWMLNPTQGFSG